MKIFCTATVFAFLLLSVNGNAQASDRKEILLIGIFHFNNPGADLAKIDKFDVLSEASQKELADISEQIKKFGPDKIFTEWPYKEQPQLDSLYSFYQHDQYFGYVEKKYPKNTFYRENEIFQLAFRAAKAVHNEKVYAIDVQTDFPFDSLMVAMDKANQQALKEKIFERIKRFEATDNENRKKYNLTELILEANRQSNRNFDLGSYISLFNPGGGKEDFTGAELVAGWYRRNLLMYSLLQKHTESKDKRLVVMLGAGHIALFRHFIELDENYKVVELKDILKGK